MINKIILLTFFFASVGCHSQIVINEVSSKNTKLIADRNGEFWDWIEIYNTGKKTVNLQNYSLSKSRKSINKWQFPRLKIKPGEFILVYASKKDSVFSNELHCDFKVNANGDVVFLFDTDNQVIDSVVCIPLAENTSYSRSVDGKGFFKWTAEPSPNTTNNPPNSIFFSSPSGFYKDILELKLKARKGTDIYYTVDGSEPSSASILYKNAIRITDQKSTPSDIGYINASKIRSRVKAPYQKATIVRAVLYKENQRLSPDYARTYFVTEYGKKRYEGMSIVALTIDSTSLFNENTGIYANGTNFNKAKGTGNYTNRGKEWEREAAMSYFNGQGELEFSQDIGIRIHGGKGRRFPQKSFRLYARKKYHSPFFNYPFFKERSYQLFKIIVLRNSYNAWGRSIIKDEFVSKLVESLHFDVLQSKPTLVFINGNYWGIYSIREYFDENYLASIYNKNPKTANIVAHGYGSLQHTNTGLIHGNADQLIALYSFLNQHSLSEFDNYQKVDSILNMESIIDYYCTQIFLNNRDWPENNNKLWNFGNGKWAQVVYDMDATCGTLNTNNIQELRNSDARKSPKPYATFLFRKLIESDFFIDCLSKRMAYLMNQVFNISNVERVLNRYSAYYDAYIPEHLDRWNVTSSKNQWKLNLERIRTFFIKRPPIIRAVFKSEFNRDLSQID